MQMLIVMLLVAGCSVFAAWTLMPAAARRMVATALLRLPLPEFAAARMRRAATKTAGCGCDGCDHAPAKPKLQTVTFHPRPKR